MMYFQPLRPIGRFVLLCLLTLCARQAAAQYYTWGADAPQKWSAIRTPHVRMIFPDTASAIAGRTLECIRTVRPDIGFGFRHGPMRIPFVLHAENFRSNGLVMYLPERVEFLTAPAVSSYSMPWYKQLVAHEYRHAVQYNNLDRGVIRVLSWLLGQQGSTVGLLCMPIWALEGDAVMSETAMSSFGRGRQPSFSMGYRAMEGVGIDGRGRRRRNIDKWFCGSYRDYVPDHYELGYQICSYAWERYGEVIWDKVARFGARNPYMIVTTSIALRKYYDTSVSELFRNTFDDLERFWDSVPRPRDSARTLVALPEGNYTAWRWPQLSADGKILALRSDYDFAERFVEVDPATGRQRELAPVGVLSSRPASYGGQVWWTEYRRSRLFDQRVASQLCRMDLSRGRPRRVAGVRNALYPVPTPDSLAWVEYTPDGRYALRCRPRDDDRAAARRMPFPRDKEVHGLAWDDATETFYVLFTDDSGMWIAAVEPQGLRPVTRGAYVTLSDLRAGGGKLYFGSIASGRDEVHCLDLGTGLQRRLTDSSYGSFSPAPAEGGVVLTTYDRRGYRLAFQPCGEGPDAPVAWSRLPRETVNPPRRPWPVVNLDTVSPAPPRTDSLRGVARRYRKGLHLVNVHSWMPLSMDPFRAVDEHNVDLNLGFTLLSQNLLSSAEAFVSYGWNRVEGSLLRLGVRYCGLGVQLSLDADYGGNQYFYSLAAYNEQTQQYEYQSRPAPDRYHSVGLSALLPLRFDCGARTRVLALSAGWNYSNGMVADLDKIEWKEGGIQNIRHIGFRRGLHKLSAGVGFSDQVRMAHRDFAPRWGYTLRADYTVNPSNASFSDLVSFYVQGYLPGAALHHSLRLAASYQTSIGGYRFPSGYAPLGYRSTRLIPQGFSSSQILSNDYAALAADYQLPLCYPDGGIGSVLYFKRIRLNLGGTCASFYDYGARGAMVRRYLWSAGGDLIFDLNLFRQPASATSTVKISLYAPSSGGVWCSAGVGLPF